MASKEEDQERRGERKACPVQRVQSLFVKRSSSSQQKTSPVPVRQEEQQLPTKDMSCPESPVPVRHKELWQPRKYQSGPDKSSLGDQVHIPCATRCATTRG
ncbi:hypothetical protein TNIN_482931 [Trichonephila inaurata madagascariensis]|uniref:Uncharacterized protein n=1 Tax=Trichonephila inaurata madagascariensis TaxID=2747483 RepID=A0A8X7C4A9_9ARAC|nr:hypothetical protein TNIN_482931 [Trichonephila inaurata madagascariensis]